MITHSLYDCAGAIVSGEIIKCNFGRPIGHNVSGQMHIRKVIRGEPLRYRSCCNCNYFESMGGIVPDEEKGWNGFRNKLPKRDNRY